jgi:hypothetical protein
MIAIPTSRVRECPYIGPAHSPIFDRLSGVTIFGDMNRDDGARARRSGDLWREFPVALLERTAS